MLRRLALTAVLWTGAAAGPGMVSAAPADAPVSAALEIEHLLGYVGASGCELYRNGLWYDARQGQDHLRLKYQFLSMRIQSAENFIEIAATKSSMSGLSYEVRCAGESPIPSAAWLTRELARFRASH